MLYFSAFSQIIKIKMLSNFTLTLTVQTRLLIMKQHEANFNNDFWNFWIRDDIFDVKKKKNLVSVDYFTH